MLTSILRGYMFYEFIVNTQKYCVKTGSDKIGSDEAIIKFEHKRQIQAFFGNAIKYGNNSTSIQRIAQDVAAPYCCSKNAPKRPDRDLLQNLYSDIDSGKLAVVLKSSILKVNDAEIKNDAIDGSFNLDLLASAKKYSNHIKLACSKFVHSEYHILEKVIHFNEDSVGVPVVIDPTSVQVHETGWKAWDNPIEIAALGALKAAFVFRAGEFLNFSKSVLAAAMIGAQIELVSGQYYVTGKSILCKKWFGSYAVRFNLKTLSFEIPWIKFKKCGPPERILVELNRKDRLSRHNKLLYNHPEILIQPFVKVEKFIADCKNGFAPPEHDVIEPTRI